MEVRNDFVIRIPSVDDIEAIRLVVENCAPVLVNHVFYTYWIIVHYYGKNCVVVEIDGKIVGWCATIATAENQYLLWQLAVLPEYRNQGIARQMLVRVFDKFSEEKATLQLTLDRSNASSHHLFKKMLEERGLDLKREKQIDALVREYNEDLYTVVF